MAGTKIASGVVAPEAKILKEATLGADSGVLGAAALARDPSSGEYVLGS